jgi:hypothetical protein
MQMRFAVRCVETFDGTHRMLLISKYSQKNCS